MADDQPAPVNPSATAVPPRGSRREVFAWAMYDWASSAYSTLSITILVSYLQADVFPGNTGVIVWGWGLGGTMLVAAILSPILGAIADAHASKRKWLAITSLTGSTAAALMYFAGPEQPWLVLLLFVIASLGFELSLGFYNGFLPEIADDRNMGRISAWGYALGYVGGGLALLLVILMFGPDTTADEAREIKRIGLGIMGLWWGIFTIPTLLFLRDKKARSREPEPFPVAARRAFGEVGSTIRNVRVYRMLAIFLVSFLLFNEGVQTMISQSSVFAMKVLEMGAGELAQVVLMIQFIALPGSLLIGHLAERLGAKRTLVGCLLLWIVLLVIAFFVTQKWQFWLMAAAAAVVLGGTQSVSRAIMGLMTPEDKSAEFFGFFNLSGKAVSVFGPVVFSTILAATGSPHLAILSLLMFFILGLIVLLPVNISKGREQARNTQ